MGKMADWALLLSSSNVSLSGIFFKGKKVKISTRITTTNHDLLEKNEKGNDSHRTLEAAKQVCKY